MTRVTRGALSQVLISRQVRSECDLHQKLIISRVL